MGVKINAKSLDRLQAQMKAAPKAVRSEYRKGLKEVGEDIAQGARERIVDKSPETARTIKVRTRMPASVIVQGGEKDKPIGKLLEGHDGIEGWWTHPLFGNEKKKYAEKRHPHLYPSFAEHKEEAVEKLKEHVKEGLAAIDLHSDD
jgi:hypothetical protein